MCVCVCTHPTPNLSAFTGSQIKWSELAINAVLSGPVGSRQARCVRGLASANAKLNAKLQPTERKRGQEVGVLLSSPRAGSEAWITGA